MDTRLALLEPLTQPRQVRDGVLMCKLGHPHGWGWVGLEDAGESWSLVHSTVVGSGVGLRARYPEHRQPPGGSVGMCLWGVAVGSGGVGVWLWGVAASVRVWVGVWLWVWLGA